MQKTKLAKAVAFALAGAALTAGSVSTASASSTTMYNKWHNQGTTPCAPCAAGETDGWVWGGVADATPSGTDTIDLTVGAGWVGTAATDKTPMGYKGGGTLNWAVDMTAAGDSAEISNADSIARYNVSADVDTAKGAWSDNALAGAAGWRHDVDFGLFRSAAGGLVTIDAVGVNNPTVDHYGFTIFKGMDISTLSNNHQNAWNANSNAAGLTTASLPGGSTNFSGLTSGTTAVKNAAAIANIVAYSIGGANPQKISNISFNAEPGQIYTIVLGGYRDGSTYDTLDGYKLNISTAAVAAVPVPGAVWLFGSAIAGFLGLRRNKKIAA